MGLNKAHFLVREAERHVKRGKFQEAIDLQDQIIELLDRAQLFARDNNVQDSLNLQIQHHHKQKHVIANKRKFYEKYLKDLKNLKIKMAKANMKNADGLQDSIYRAFEETESLLAHLKTETIPSDPTTGEKMPKDDKVIIEELQTANNHLRGMVESMFSELESYKKENLETEDREIHKVGHVSNLSVVGLQTGLLHDSGHLPPLAPLELPVFDFGTKTTD